MTHLGRLTLDSLTLSDTPEARTEAAAQRRQLDALLRDSPACLASLSGPDHMVTVANQLFRHLFSNRHLAGLSLRDALPELREQPFFSLLDEAYATGIVCYARREVSYLDATQLGSREPVYFTFIAQAVRATPAAPVTGLLLFAYDVSAHVQARDQTTGHQAPPATTIQQLALANAQLVSTNEELATTNEELSVTNAELDATNDQLAESNQQLALANALLTATNIDIRNHVGVLHQTQKALRALNRQLEVRVEERTSQLQTELVEQGKARQLLEQLSAELALAHASLQAAHVDTELINAALCESNTLLTRTNADLNSFVYAASHDLKLPILNLAGLIEKLRRGVTFTDPAEEQVLMPLIADTLRQLHTTLDDLAALGQLQQATHAPPEALVLTEVVAEVLQGLEPQVKAARARVTIDGEAQHLVSCPRAMLCTILHNLLSNSLKYAHPNRPARIHLSLWLDAGQPVLWVQDNGLGFDAAALGPDPFQLFRRFHAQTEGTGVGLYLINRLVLANGGRIEVDSRVGEGATVRVYLGHTPRP
jgi:signal transduction histidine kinase